MLLANLETLLGRHVPHLALDAVQLTDELNRRGGEGALVGLHEVDEVPARGIKEIKNTGVHYGYRRVPRAVAARRSPG